MPLNLFEQASDPAFKPRRFKTGSGLYYTASDVDGSETAILLTQDRLVCIPFTIGVATLFSAISLEVTTLGAASTVRLGMYMDDGSGAYPGLLLFDAGTIDGTTTGAKEISLATTPLPAGRTIPPGVWWMGYAAQGGAPTVRGRTGVANHLVGAANGTTSAPTCYFQAGVSGALPVQFTTTPAPATDIPAKVMLKVP